MWNKIKVYLAGACKYEEDGGRGWRKQFGCDSRIKAYGIECFNPTKYFNYEEQKHKTQKQVKEYYFSQMKNCDVVVVNLNNSATSTGTAQEVQFAVDNGIPVIGFGHENMAEWVAEVDCQVVFDTMNEVIEYLWNYYVK